jgi:nitroreductase
MTRKSSSSEAWELCASDFPGDGSARDRLAFLLRYALLAPSTHNTQPWRFTVGPDRILLFRDRSRWLQVADPTQREMHLSLGCALENLLIAARAFGYRPQVTHFPRQGSADCVAEVLLPAPAKPTRPRGGLLEAITRRHTSRKPFRPRAVPVEDSKRIEAVCGDRAVMLFLSDDPKIKGQLERLVAEADARLFAEPAYREELGRWIGEGTFGTSWLLSKLGQVAVTYLNVGRSTGRHDSELLHSAPQVGILATLDDGRGSQVRSGQQFERICLQAELLGLGVQPMSQLCQVPHIRAQLARFFPAPDVHPQQVFRIGFADRDEIPMPRRALEEMIT